MTAPAGAARLRGPVGVGLAGKAAEAVTLVLLATVVPRRLGPVDYGLFAVALTVVAIGSVALTLGGATLLARYVPAAPAGERAALARALSLRLARNRAAVLAGLAVLAGALALADPVTFPPLPTALVLAALALNVAATLALQADLGLGRAGAWCARYPLQNAVLVVAAVALYGTHGATGAVAAIAIAGAVGAGVGAVAVAPLLRGRLPAATLPDGALRFGMLQAAGGALAQFAQRGGVVAVALLAASAAQTGYAALALGVALAATYAVVQVFTVALPRLAERPAGPGGEAALRRLAGGLLAVVLPGVAVAAVLVDAAVPLVFGSAFAGAAPAFGPAMALVVLAPVNALLVQAAALRLRPDVTLYAALAGAAAFLAVAALAVPGWAATGATAAALAGAAASAVLAARMLPGAAGAPLTVASLAGAAAVAVLGVLG